MNHFGVTKTLGFFDESIPDREHLLSLQQHNGYVTELTWGNTAADLKASSRN